MVGWTHAGEAHILASTELDHATLDWTARTYHLTADDLRNLRPQHTLTAVIHRYVHIVAPTYAEALAKLLFEHQWRPDSEAARRELAASLGPGGNPRDEAGRGSLALPPSIAAIDDAVAAGASAPWAPGEREAMAAPAPDHCRLCDAELHYWRSDAPTAPDVHAEDCPWRLAREHVDRLEPEEQR
jgi:hypothetical protein